MQMSHMVEGNITKRQSGRVFPGICRWETATVLGLSG